MTRSGYVYLMANRRRGKTYLGVTSNLVQRVYQHRNKLIEGYSKEHDCSLLVWFETHDDIQDARAREWKLKKWRREWKIALIEEGNPEWRDLYHDIV
ncbi:GIY-YIG nuclease family protein [Sphingorhabdus sp. YGSMI21]|uniref:GIY-YIG nuclease family protein n=1 Tax=Sphingorhabdus sp. YGSMI21 TaxID=2077182 RepID=UPI000C1DDEFE|nr:GIY-YIG nuclease family protein [Sphingorhabdus sp. YGSMI21]ATW04055.1 endonuclease [Sphingorhabdus sp. YGSMI21]